MGLACEQESVRWTEAEGRGGMRDKVIPDGSNRATQNVGRALCIQEAAGSVVGWELTSSSHRAPQTLCLKAMRCSEIQKFFGP